MSINDLVPWRVSRSRMPARREEENPFSILQQDFDRLFNELAGLSRWSYGEVSGSFVPSINVTDQEKMIIVSAELPGMDENDIELTLTGDELTIKGEKKKEHEEKDGNFYRIERSYGAFCRSIPLRPNAIDADNVEAHFSKGVLTIHLPKVDVEPEMSKRINVKVD